MSLVQNISKALCNKIMLLISCSAVYKIHFAVNLTKASLSDQKRQIPLPKDKWCIHLGLFIYLTNRYVEDIYGKRERIYKEEDI